MAVLEWHKVGEKLFETGVDRGVLYLPDVAGLYNTGFAWNGLVSITESPSGAEASPQYADNQKYLNLVSAEDFGGTIEAFTCPDEFFECDGTVSPEVGMYVGQQPRKTFGLSYRTKIGNDIDGADHGYKLHIIYGALAAPTERTNTTINDSPEAMTLSWEITTTPVPVPGHKPTSKITLNSTKVAEAKMTQIEDMLYGAAATMPKLPTPAEIIGVLSAV